MNNLTEKWIDLIEESLQKDDSDAKIFALDFLSHQETFDKESLSRLTPFLKSSLVSSDTKVRYYAKAARSHILESFPGLFRETNIIPEDFHIEDTGGIMPVNVVLLHKMRLGSRYLFFEAAERLTESGDPDLIDPLLRILSELKDEYKLSFLVKRMSNFEEQRVGDALVPFLDHTDQRVVANTLEALVSFDCSKIKNKLTELASSPDNRIRANALIVLHKYLPEVAEKHIYEMVRSKNIALQASGVFLLEKLRPSNLVTLLPIALKSTYSSVRMKALGIIPPTDEEMQEAEVQSKEDRELISHNRDTFYLCCIFALAAALMYADSFLNKSILVILFMAVGGLLMLRPDNIRTSIQKTIVSMGFLSSLVWGPTVLIVIPGLVGLWIIWNNGKVNKYGNPEKAPAEHLTAWFFSVAAVVVTQLITGDKSNIIWLASRLGSFLPPESLKPFESTINTQCRFDVTAFVLISAMTVALIRFRSWFPLKRNEHGKIVNSSAKRKLVLVACLFLVSIAFVDGANYVSGLMGEAIETKNSPPKILYSVLKECITKGKIK